MNADPRAEPSDRVPRCPNCLAELTGAYCAHCGQKRIHAEEFSIRHYFRLFADEIADVRGRFKMIRSLRALLTPGFATTEYLAGHRQRYLSPLKLYFVCAALFFLSAPWAGFQLTTLIERDASGKLEGLVSARMAELKIDRAHFAERFNVRIQTVYTLSLTVSVFVLAIALQLLFRRQSLPFGAHLILALHYVAVLYLITMAAGLAVEQLKAPTTVAILVAVGVMAVYLTMAVKRVYENSIGVTLLKSGALFVLTMILNNVVDAGAIRLTLRLV